MLSKSIVIGSPSAQEINAARAMLNQYAGIPLGKIQGFRAPFRKYICIPPYTFFHYKLNTLFTVNYTAETLNNIAQQGFLYDTSSTAVTDDCYWLVAWTMFLQQFVFSSSDTCRPYTLDNGMANDCWTGICNGQVKLPGKTQQDDY